VCVKGWPESEVIMRRVDSRSRPSERDRIEENGNEKFVGRGNSVIAFFALVSQKLEI